MKILLVDDDPDLQLLASFALEKIGGHEVVTSEGGPEVVALALRERPEVILMDFLLPELDGAELVRRLRAEPTLAATPVIFLTGKENAADHRRMMDAGALGVLVKPFDPEALPRRIEDLLAGGS